MLPKTEPKTMKAACQCPKPTFSKASSVNLMKRYMTIKGKAKIASRIIRLKGNNKYSSKLTHLHVDQTATFPP